ncbi:putative angiogenesis [Lyophyllum shimeji]|uniref:Angiogenesis n=1 Tax=Lyophyllum shimeji TaxID=47721 RepID=A0A9P3PRU8_LYOSH|nr:putative angiogenesis [Lyophyllum shimeji]
MAGKTAVLLGGTGQTGQKILKELLQSPDFTKVGEYGRRVTDAAAITTGKDKLVQKKIDFEKLGEAGLKDDKWDVVFIALGTTRKAAGSAENFEKIDREYVINAAREAKADNPDQRLVYISSTGANPSSIFLYPRSKGLTENGLAALGYSDTIIFRPAFLVGTQRPERENFLISAVTPIVGLAARFSDKMQIDISTLAKSAVTAGRLGSSALPPSACARKEGKDGATFTVIDNPGAIALAAEAS